MRKPIKHKSNHNTTKSKHTIRIKAKQKNKTSEISTKTRLTPCVILTIYGSLMNALARHDKSLLFFYQGALYSRESWRATCEGRGLALPCNANARRKHAICIEFERFGCRSGQFGI